MTAAPAIAGLPVGIHFGVPEADYHADPAPSPSLSRSLAWTLARRAPIHGFLEHPRLNPDFKHEDPNAAMDFGDLGHALLLGGADRIDVGDWENFKKDAAQEWRDSVRAAGRIPALKRVYAEALVLAECAREHIKALGFLDEFDRAKNEVTVIAKHDDQYLRCRFDKLLIDPDGAKNRMRSEIAVAFDLKITGDAAPDTLAKHIGNQGYDLQQVHYLRTLGEADPKFRGRTQFIFLFIEAQPPHCVTAIELDGQYLALGESRWARAFARWKRGVTRNEWPTYADGAGAFSATPPKYMLNHEMGVE